ncbi:MAG: head-tail connector protein [Pseudomonadota bacterium]
MLLTEDTSVADSVLPLEVCKDHMRLGSGFSTDAMQDALILSFLRAAFAAIEARTGKALLMRQFRWTLYKWSDPVAQVLPIAPVTEIADLRMKTRFGVTTPIAPTAYWLEQSAHRPRLRAATAALPTIPTDGSVDVVFEAGYGPSWDRVPDDLQQAVLMLAAHFYEFRSDTGLEAQRLPFGVSSLIETYRSVRMGTGVAQ